MALTLTTATLFATYYAPSADDSDADRDPQLVPIDADVIFSAVIDRGLAEAATLSGVSVGLVSAPIPAKLVNGVLVDDLGATDVMLHTFVERPIVYEVRFSNVRYGGRPLPGGLKSFKFNLPADPDRTDLVKAQPTTTSAEVGSISAVIAYADRAYESALAAGESRELAEIARAAAATSASEAAASAAQAATLISNASEDISDQLDAIVGYVNTATSAATTATTKAGEADNSRVLAEAAATNADASKTAAASSASQAETFRNTASTHADTATAKSEIASSKANEAAGSATAAALSAQDADADRTAAQTARAGAETARDEAQGHATSAGSSALSASSSASDAAGSASAAAGSASDASSSASAAAGSASDAAGSASNAVGSAQAAAGSAVEADGHADRAETAADSFDLTATATTGAVGSNATVAVTGDGPAYGLSFTIPRGDKGEPGDKGDRGDDGEVSQAMLDAAVASLVDGAPEALDTLTELAAALGDDPNFAATVSAQIGERAKTADVNAALAGKASTSHSHAWGDITSKPTTFAPSAHTHTTAQVTGLDAALAGKASTSHTHTPASLGAVARSGSAVTLWSGTQAQYDALAEATKNAAGFIAVITE